MRTSDKIATVLLAGLLTAIAGVAFGERDTMGPGIASTSSYTVDGGTVNVLQKGCGGGLCDSNTTHSSNTTVVKGNLTVDGGALVVNGTELVRGSEEVRGGGFFDGGTLKATGLIIGQSGAQFDGGVTTAGDPGTTCATALRRDVPIGSGANDLVYCLDGTADVTGDREGDWVVGGTLTANASMFQVLTDGRALINPTTSSDGTLILRNATTTGYSDINLHNSSSTLLGFVGVFNPSYATVAARNAMLVQNYASQAGHNLILGCAANASGERCVTVSSNATDTTHTALSIGVDWDGTYDENAFVLGTGAASFETLAVGAGTTIAKMVKGSIADGTAGWIPDGAIVLFTITENAASVTATSLITVSTAANAVASNCFVHTQTAATNFVVTCQAALAPANGSTLQYLIVN